MAHSIEIDFQRDGDLAHRRQAFARLQHAGSDRGQYLVADLDIDRYAVGFDVKRVEHRKPVWLSSYRLCASFRVSSLPWRCMARARDSKARDARGISWGHSTARSRW